MRRADIGEGRCVYIGKGRYRRGPINYSKFILSPLSPWIRVWFTSELVRPWIRVLYGRASRGLSMRHVMMNGCAVSTPTTRGASQVGERSRNVSTPASPVAASSSVSASSHEDSSDSDDETEPAKCFHRRLSTNKDIQITVRKCFGNPSLSNHFYSSWSILPRYG